MTPPRLTAANSVLLVVDWQERLHAAMPEPHRDGAVRRASDLIWLAEQLEVPIVRTEQYPHGLGSTIAPLAGGIVVEKITFSCLGTPEFVGKLREIGRDHVVVCGMETHVCVAQTCRDLVAGGWLPWLVADATLSRHTLDWTWGLRRVDADGGRVVTAEAVLFEWTERAGTPVFKELSRRLR